VTEFNDRRGLETMRMQTRLLWWFGAFALLSVFLWPSFASIVAIWERSETFTHGFLVVPIVLFLIWRKRHGLGVLHYGVDWRALPILAGTGFVWLLARLVDVLVIEQLAAVFMVPILVWLIFGLAAVRYLAFPLLFLFFAVPMGEWLVPPLMDFTAIFTVFLLRLTGIPVYWEGTFFSIPSGDWSVVAACSGIRYLIASVFLGVLYAYLNYRALWRRLLFIALAAITPILANGLRAYLIVMIGHLSDMRLAVGVDHLIYGWVFFGLVMFLLFAFGNLWSDAERPSLTEAELPAFETRATPPVPPTRETLGLSLGLLLLVVWPLLGIWIEARAVAEREWPGHEIASELANWSPMDTNLSSWTPQFLETSATWRQDFAQGDEQLGVYLALYGQGSGEMVSSEHVLVHQSDRVWRLLEQTSRSVDLGDGTRRVTEVRLKSTTQSLLVWDWYWTNGYQTTSPHLAKLHEALTLLGGQRLNQARIALYTPIELDAEPARARLETFARALLPRLEIHLRALTEDHDD
jgi:exosortase A